MKTWLLLHYSLPTQPSALRVHVWRKLKRLGAIFLNESVWVLPDTPRTAEQFQWLSAEIQEMGGDAYFWKSTLVLGAQEENLVAQFAGQAEQAYTALLKKLDRKRLDLPALSQEYQQINGKDYFHSEIGEQVRKRLLSLRGDRL